MSSQPPPKKPTISIIGSLNIDFITRTNRLPLPGETLSALSFDQGFGGKGANQAVACARLAGEDVGVRMVGNVGGDGFGREYLEALREEGMDVGGVRVLEEERTGVTNIVVEESSGENRILFVANANWAFGEEYEEGWEMVGGEESGEVVVFQLEIPSKVVLHNMTRARQAGKHVIVNPAPAIELPKSTYSDMDTLVMNETEACILAGTDASQADNQTTDQLITAAKQFLSWGVRDAVIITLGGKGLVYATASGAKGHIGAHKVSVVDTTAAGDTFVGGYAVQRARNNTSSFDYEKALEFATLAASKTVQKHGAMASIPKLSEL